MSSMRDIHPMHEDEKEMLFLARVAIRIAAVCTVILLVLMILSSCSPRIYERIVVQHDTTTVVKVDSIWQYQHDSVFVKEKGDTVFKYVERIRYRDRFKVDTLVRVREVHDTTSVEVEVEKPLSWVKSAKIGAFPWLVGALILALLWIFRKPITKLLRI